MSANIVQRSFIIPVLDFSTHSSYNITTLLEDLKQISGEVICIFNSHEVFDKLRYHERIDKFCFNSHNAGVSRSWNIGINLSESDVDDMFAQANTMGIDITTNPDLLEFVYKATNYDSALEQGRQQQLANSKKRSKTAAGRTGTRGRPTEESDNWDNEIESILREQRLIK